MDGSIHDLKEVQKNDQKPQGELENCGLGFLRFTNKQVKENLHEVQQKIESFILENSDPKEKKH